LILVIIGGRLLIISIVDGRIAPRSGLAAKHFIDTGAGVIDADYRGEVKVLLFNHSDVDFPGMYTLSLGLVWGFMLM
jgi:dUTPase